MTGRRFYSGSEVMKAYIKDYVDYRDLAPKDEIAAAMARTMEHFDRDLKEILQAVVAGGTDQTAAASEPSASAASPAS